MLTPPINEGAELTQGPLINSLLSLHSGRSFNFAKALKICNAWRFVTQFEITSSDSVRLYFWNAITCTHTGSGRSADFPTAHNRGLTHPTPLQSSLCIFCSFLFDFLLKEIILFTDDYQRTGWLSVFHMWDSPPQLNHQKSQQVS
jgi:hypothetical protein